LASPPRLPTFIIGGAPRSGTNFLCHALERHPEVYVARPYMPEPKVFFGPPRTDEEYRVLYARLFREAGGRRALGEKTANYFESEIACARIHAHLPEVRLLFLLREPVTRAYSNYLWSRKNGLETLSFEEAVELEGQRPSPLPPAQWHARPFDYLCRGRYDTFARRYYERFPRERVAFFLYEAMIAEPEKVLAAIQEFIGVLPRPLGAEDLGVINSAREVGPTLDPTLARALRTRMAVAVRDFHALTGVDVGPWGYDAPAT
jgi:Sulfotransferase domain